MKRRAREKDATCSEKETEAEGLETEKVGRGVGLSSASGGTVDKK